MTTTAPRSSGNEMQNEPMNRTIRTVLFGVPSGKRDKKRWKITMLLMGKSTISTGPFSIAILT